MLNSALISPNFLTLDIFGGKAWFVCGVPCEKRMFQLVVINQIFKLFFECWSTQKVFDPQGKGKGKVETEAQGSRP